MRYLKKNFVIYYCGEEEEFTQANADKIAEAMYGFIKSDARLAVEVELVDEDEIRRLNRELRQVDKVTDVLSFPALSGIKGLPIAKKDFFDCMDENGNLLIGSIAVCAKRAREQAEEYAHSFNREIHYLIVHGIMHCLGYDHMTDGEKAEMRAAEEFILQKMGITRED